MKQEEIKSKFIRTQKALTLKPALGIGVKVSKTRIISGLSCESREGDYVLKTDMPSQVGGNETGPTAGVLGRAALGSCLAIGYMMWASRLDVTIDSLEVQIEAIFDDGALFDTSDSPPGYTEIKYHVKVVSPSRKEDVEKAINEGDKHSPYLDVFSRAQHCVRKLEIETT